MMQTERLDYLIEYLLWEDVQYTNQSIPQDTESKQRLLRALLNTRLPKACTDEFLRIQDEYLQIETAAKGVSNAATLSTIPRNSRIAIWQGDITALKIGAIVNAANSGMLGCFRPNHGCIDNVIHTYSGVQLRLECADLMKKQGHEEAIGTAKITGAYNLPCDSVLHTVGPIVHGRLTKPDSDLLANCYNSCLNIAAENNVESIAFCCISTGEFHFPNQAAAEIAVKTVTEFLNTNTTIKKVIFNVFKEIDNDIYSKLLGAN